MLVALCCVAAGTLCQAIWPDFSIYSIAASSVYSIPFWRHFIAWLGAVPATPGMGCCLKQLTFVEQSRVAGSFAVGALMCYDQGSTNNSVTMIAIAMRAVCGQQWVSLGAGLLGGCSPADTKHVPAHYIAGDWSVCYVALSMLQL